MNDKIIPTLKNRLVKNTNFIFKRKGGKMLALDLCGNDITDKVIIYTGPTDAALYRKLASEILEKASRFYDEEIINKRHELTNEEWSQKHAEYREMMNIAGDYEDKELASRLKKIIHFISERDENPLKAKVDLIVGFSEYLVNLPKVAALI
jgi:hypothetical protein